MLFIDSLWFVSYFISSFFVCSVSFVCLPPFSSLSLSLFLSFFLSLSLSLSLHGVVLSFPSGSFFLCIYRSIYRFRYFFLPYFVLIYFVSYFCMSFVLSVFI